MNVQRALKRAIELPKIVIPDPDFAVETIADAIRKQKLLQFDNSTAVLKFDNHYSRLAPDECEAFIIALLPPEMQIAVSSSQIKEVIRRLQFMPQLQIDLQAEFWKSQMFVNLKMGCTTSSGKSWSTTVTSSFSTIASALITEPGANWRTRPFSSGSWIPASDWSS